MTGKNRTLRRERGTTLIEMLVSLTLFILIILGGLDFFARSRRLFFRLDAVQDEAERAFAALDRARLDAREAGRGLSGPLRLELLQGIDIQDDIATFLSAEAETVPTADIPAGASFLPLAVAEGFAAGREVCVFDRTHGEIRVISSVDPGGIGFAVSLAGGYRREETSVVLIRKVSLFWDRESLVLKRKINASSPQPLVEDLAEFRCRLESIPDVLKMGIRLKTAPENEYATTIFLKNMALARTTDAP